MAVRDASDEQLLAAYRHYAGKSPVRFASRAHAVRCVVHAMMASADLAGRLGVPRGVLPAPTAWEVLVARAQATRRADALELAQTGLQDDGRGVELDARADPFSAGSVASGLWRAQASARTPPAPRPTVQAQPRCPRTDADPICVLKGAGTARVRPDSERGRTLARVTAAGAAGVRLSELVAELGPAARGHVGKLRATQHITLKERNS